MYINVELKSKSDPHYYFTSRLYKLFYTILRNYNKFKNYMITFDAASNICCVKNVISEERLMLITETIKESAERINFIKELSDNTARIYNNKYNSGCYSYV